MRDVSEFLGDALFAPQLCVLREGAFLGQREYQSALDLMWRAPEVDVDPTPVVIIQGTERLR